LKNHIDQIIPKLVGLCYAVKSVLQISNSNTLKPIYCAKFHFIKVWNKFLRFLVQRWEYFYLQKTVVRITFGAQPKTPCTNPFNKLKDYACTTPTHTYINELHCQ